MNHGRADFPAELARGDQTGHRRRRHRPAALVDHKTPVGVAVEGQPYIGTDRADVFLQVGQVRRVQRVGLVVGERTVELEVQRQQRDRPNRTENRRCGVAGHPVARVDGHPQRPQPGGVHQRAQEGSVVGQHVFVTDGSGGPAVSRNAGDQVVTDRGQPGLSADGFGARPAHLDAVVGGRVVTRGKHRTRAVQQPGGEVELIGRRQADADHVETLRGDPGPEGGGQRRRTVAHVVADDDLPRVLVTHQPGERSADLGNQRLVDLLTDQTPHVICLDHTVNDRSGSRHQEAPDDGDVSSQA